MRDVAERYWSWMCQPGVQPFAVPGSVNHGVLDFFSVLHMLGGVAFGAFGVGLLPTFILVAGWELAEHLLKNACPRAFIHPSQDTLVNAGSDILFALIGWCVGWRWRVTRSPGLAS